MLERRADTFPTGGPFEWNAEEVHSQEPTRPGPGEQCVGGAESERRKKIKCVCERDGRMKLRTMAGGGGQEGGERRAKAPSSAPASWQGLRGHASRGGQTSFCEEAVKEIGRRAAVL